MLIDVTLLITAQMAAAAQENEKKVLAGHLGTHFDIMDKKFPLEYTEREAVVFDVSHVHGRDIDISDIDMDAVGPDMFVAFYTGFIDRENYGSRPYFAGHPQLSHELIDALLDRKISIIGVDCAGIRRGREHTPADQYCADRGVFVVENLCNLRAVPGHCIMHTYPMNYAGVSGLPCRVVAETGEGEV
ncbi:MAG: cyclase family protein [Solobacterium sp.]|nr:cyclase family protein [Solobacterium sp.]